MEKENKNIKMSFPKFVVGNLPLSTLLLKEDKQPCFNEKVEDPRQKRSGMTPNFNNNAFTLIELLVVVLIIGILAAVAVPQYQKAVEKARAATIFPLLKAIGNAQENYYLANGTYATSFDELSVDIPFTGTEKWATYSGFKDVRSNDDWSIQLYPNTVHAVFAGRLTGQYAGTGFAYYYGDWGCPPDQNGYGICAHTLTCVKKKTDAGGVALTPAGEQYCAKFFKAKGAIQSGTVGRYYAMP